MNRRALIIQKPRSDEGLDLDSLQKMGELGFLLPAAPNIHDFSRMEEDIKRMSTVIQQGGGDDLFTAVGGSPISHILFAAAAIRAGKSKLSFGLYSRGRDSDGRRGASAGSYRELPVPLIV